MKGVVGFSTPTDLRSASSLPNEAQAVANLLGAPPETVPALAALASPLVHAGAGDAPTLFIHGVNDSSVPVGQARALHAALSVSGVASTLIEFPRLGHAMPILGAQPEVRAATCTVLEFLRTRI